MTPKPESTQPRKDMPSPRLGEDEFKQRFLDQFQDSAFGSLQAELRKIADTAWDGYSHSRKSPNTPRVLDLEPMVDPARAVVGAEGLRHDTLAAKCTCMLEDGAAIAGEMPVESGSVASASKEIGERSLAVL